MLVGLKKLTANRKPNAIARKAKKNASLLATWLTVRLAVLRLVK
jgi:hypothetical protein